MPELPDLTVYIHALNTRVAGRRLVGVRLLSPFVLRSVDPPLEAINGRTVQAIFRLGKRIVLTLAAATDSPSSPTSSSVEDELFLVVHLMIAGRLRWREPHQKSGVGPRMILAAFEFEHGTLLFTEAGSKKRASLHLVRGRRGVEALRPRRRRAARGLVDTVSGVADAREPHAQAHPDRSASVQRHRQCLFGRDPACGASVAAQVIADAVRRRSQLGCTRPRARR